MHVTSMPRSTLRGPSCASSPGSCCAVSLRRHWMSSTAGNQTIEVASHHLEQPRKPLSALLQLSMLWAHKPIERLLYKISRFVCIACFILLLVDMCVPLFISPESPCPPFLACAVPTIQRTLSFALLLKRLEGANQRSLLLVPVLFVRSLTCRCDSVGRSKKVSIIRCSCLAALPTVVISSPCFSVWPIQMKTEGTGQVVQYQKHGLYFNTSQLATVNDCVEVIMMIKSSRSSSFNPLLSVGRALEEEISKTLVMQVLVHGWWYSSCFVFACHVTQLVASSRLAVLSQLRSSETLLASFKIILVILPYQKLYRMYSTPLRTESF